MGKRSEFQRRKNDKYRTPFDAVAALVPHLDGVTFAEPCAGDGRLVRHLTAHGLVCVHMSDIEPDDLMMMQADALTVDMGEPDEVITNPPWSRPILHQMIMRFVQVAPTWLLFDADWAHTKQARPYMRLCSDIVPIGRVKWIENSKHSGKDNAAWYRFQSTPAETRFHER